METKRIGSGDAELRYLEVPGAGRPLVLLHGLTGHRDDFVQRLPDLADAGRLLAHPERVDSRESRGLAGGDPRAPRAGQTLGERRACGGSGASDRILILALCMPIFFQEQPA